MSFVYLSIVVVLFSLIFDIKLLSLNTDHLSSKLLIFCSTISKVFFTLSSFESIEIIFVVPKE